MMKISQVKVYLDRSYFLIVFLLYAEDINCGGLEKCILKIVLAAINDMKEDNLLKRNE